MAIDFTKINEKNIGKLFDPSVLPKNSTKEEIIAGAKDAVKYNTMSFVVSSPYYLPIVVDILAGTDVLPCSCIDFPFGASLGVVKAFETEWGVKRGAKAFDLVMNIGALRIFEQRIQLRRVEAGQRHIKVRALKISDQQRELILIPLAADLV